MLTSKNFRDIKLRRVHIGGYKAEDVNMFVDDAKLSILKLEEEKSELLNKVNSLIQKNSKYKNEQESIRTALVKAQVLADSSVEEARITANDIINKANADAEKILENARKEAEICLEESIKKVNMQKEQLASLKKSVKSFRSNVLTLYKEHIKLVNSLSLEGKLSEGNSKSAENIKSISDLEKNKVEVDENREEAEIGNNSDAKIENDGNKSINKKFVNLKFGEDYDITKDTEESSVGLFSKIQ